jgi:enterochelin esterase family protein
MRRMLSLALLAASLSAFAQTPTPPPPLQSHEVHSDGSITFRYANASASAVTVSTDAALQPLPMQRDSSGVWTVFTPALPPEWYSYSFIVDGVQHLDPLNNEVVPNLVSGASRVLVPGHPPAPWELTEIPHGAYTHHFLTTQIARNLPMNQESYIVYTPPGYDAKHKGGYPVLYLLHGWSDSADAWTDVGQANLILDSLLATGKIVPMIVVMPLGYGDYSFVTSGHDVWNDPAKVDENLNLDSNMLLQEVVPAVEREYNIAKGRQNHAIAGLSMGGLESLTIGINHAGQFAWVGGFSSAVQGRQFDKHMMDPGQARDLRLLWVACGASDNLIQPNRDFVTWARSKKLPVTPIETAGKHTWLVWRDNLIHFAPLLFR